MHFVVVDAAGNVGNVQSATMVDTTAASVTVLEVVEVSEGVGASMQVRVRFEADEPGVRVFWRADVPSASTRTRAAALVDTSALGAEVQSGDTVTMPRGNALYLTGVDASNNVSPTQSYRVSEAAPQTTSSTSAFGGGALTAVIAGVSALIALLALLALMAVRRRRRRLQERDILSGAHGNKNNNTVGEADGVRSRGMLPEFETYTLKEGSLVASTPKGTTAAMTPGGGTTTARMTQFMSIQHGYAMTEPGGSEFSVGPEEEGDPYYTVQGMNGARV
jgi:hypothetical protein